MATADGYYEDPLGLTTCPFEPAHKLQRKRMQYHIIACMKNQDMRKWKKCPFNAQHYVPVDKYDDHVRTCEGRAVVEKQMLYSLSGGNAKAGHLKSPTSNFTVPQSSESWDDDNYTVLPTPATLQPPPAAKPPPARRDDLQVRMPRKPQDSTSTVYQSSLSTGRGRGSHRPAGIGRGRGKSPAAYPPGLRMAETYSNTETETATETATDVEMTPQQRAAKDLRKLRKMLRQIESLEGRAELNEDQRMKVERKADVLAAIEDFSSRHPGL